MKAVCALLVLGMAAFAKSFVFEDVVSDFSCAGRCGANYDKARPCQCNTQCTRFNNCCGDYTAQCDSSGGSSCKNRCGASYDKSLPCQCNSQCSSFGNCCQDLGTHCGSGYSKPTTSAWTASGKCVAFSDITEALWSSDVDRLSTSDVRINDQDSVRSSDFRDKASQKLFSYVADSKLDTTVYKAYLALLDNYDRDKWDAEWVTTQEKAEEDTFLDAIMATTTFQTLYDYLKCEGQVQSTSSFRSNLREIWFELFKRSSSGSNLDTSGFEHVMVGDYKSRTEASGMHYWLSFYEEEKSGDLNYYGRSCQTQTNFVCPAFDWNGRKKYTTSFFLRTSPAFDMAIYTLCFIFYTDEKCPTVIDGRDIEIQTFSLDGHLSTAYIVG